MFLARRITLLLALAAGLSVGPASAQQAVTLKLSWDHCSADGQVSDRSFACNTNAGDESIYASMVIVDGYDRPGVVSFSAFMDLRFTSGSLPPWWQTLTGQCRANAISVSFGPFIDGGSCAPWYAGSGPNDPIGVFQLQPGSQGPASVRVQLGAGLPAPYEATLHAGQELLLFRVIVRHSKSVGAGACTGCTVPTCIGFGQLGIQHSSPPDEKYLGTPASAVTWQGAYVTGYAPVADYYDYAYHSYVGNLSCSTGPVPAQGRTWGLIKTFYR